MSTVLDGLVRRVSPPPTVIPFLDLCRFPRHSTWSWRRSYELLRGLSLGMVLFVLDEREVSLAVTRSKTESRALLV